MYSEHPAFPQRESDEAKIWRYIDLTKLLALLESQQIYFPRADKLGDPFEGSWPRRNVTDRNVVPPELPKEIIESYLSSTQRSANGMSRAYITYVAVSCWHLNEHESAAMWNQYLSSNAGVAIQSTYGNLRKCFTEEEPVYVGSVRYIDYEHDVIPAMNMLQPFTHKRKSFEHEREVRAAVMRVSDVVGADMLPKPAFDEGVSVSIDIRQLISAIYIAPNSPNWFHELVRSIVRKYGFQFSVIQSDMDKKPLF